MGEVLTGRSSGSPVSPHKGNMLIFVEIVGFGMLAFFTIVLLASVQTTEAFVLHSGSVDVFHPNWGIILQIPALFAGQLSSSEAQAAIVGWGIELLYLAFIVGYEILKEAVHTASGARMANVCRSLGFVLIGFCGYTDYLYGSIGSGIVGHILFATVSFVGLAYFGTIGWAFIVYGWKKA